MKNLLLRLCKILLPMLGVSVVISCDDKSGGSSDTCVPMYGAVVAEYGVMLVEYRVTGKVVDKEDNPIADILVGDDYSCNHALTDDDGTFVFESQGVIFESVTLNFRDLDGEDNGGQFETKYQQVTLSQDNYEANDVEVVMNK